MIFDTNVNICNMYNNDNFSSSKHQTLHTTNYLFYPNKVISFPVKAQPTYVENTEIKLEITVLFSVLAITGC